MRKLFGGTLFFFLLKSKFEGIKKKNRGFRNQNIHVFLVTPDFVSTGRFLFAFQTLPREYENLITSV